MKGISDGLRISGAQSVSKKNDDYEVNRERQRSILSRAYYCGDEILRRFENEFTSAPN